MKMTSSRVKTQDFNLIKTQNLKKDQTEKNTD